MSNLSNEKKPILLVMAAGMGSRYGGIKQIDPITDNGCVLLDFGIYDALKANFGKIVFVIRRDIEKDFKSPSLLVMVRLAKALNVEITDLYRVRW